MIKKIILFFCLFFGATTFVLYLLATQTIAKINGLPKTHNVLILGLDPRDDAIEKTQTTDTIIFASFNFNTRHLSLVSLPRDLWSYQTNTKINQIYPDSLNQGLLPDWSKLKEEFNFITGQKIDSVIVVTTQNLIDLVGLLGGVNVNLQHGFVDHSYPNPAYIKNPSSSTPIYITVEFPAGNNLIDSSNVVPFVRSRKGSDNPALGGTDLGRIERQQLLVENLFKQSLQPSSMNFTKVKNLYHYWKTILTNIDDRLFFDLGLKFLLSSPISTPISLIRTSLPVEEGKVAGIIYHPQTFVTPAWVFIPKDKGYREIHQFIQKEIN